MLRVDRSPLQRDQKRHVVGGLELTAKRDAIGSKTRMGTHAGVPAPSPLRISHLLVNQVPVHDIWAIAVVGRELFMPIGRRGDFGRPHVNPATSQIQVQWLGAMTVIIGICLLLLR